MLDCILVKRYFHITKSSIFEWSIFMQQKYFSSLVLNTDRNCTRCQQQLKIREVYLSHYLLFTLKDEVPTWPLCSTCQQPQGSRRSGFRHYPFMRRKNERNISREFVRYIGVKHHLLWLWQEEVHHHWPVLAALVFHLGGKKWLSTTFEGQQNHFECQPGRTKGQICVRTNRYKDNNIGVTLSRNYLGSLDVPTYKSSSSAWDKNRF